MCGQNVELLKVTTGGRYNDHSVANVLTTCSSCDTGLPHLSCRVGCHSYQFTVILLAVSKSCIGNMRLSGSIRMTNGYSNIYTLTSQTVQFVSFAYGK